MAKIDVKTIRDAENSVRDVRNWLAVFKTEYRLSAEAYRVLHNKIEDLGTKIGGIKCMPAGKIDKDSVKQAANTLRDSKSWLAVFAKEYNVPKEAVKVLHSNLDTIGEKLAAIKCN